MADTYTTISGDTWDIIARKLWDRETLCSELMAANPDYAGTVMFGSGVVLTVPDIETSTDAEITTPPWSQS